MEESPDTQQATAWAYRGNGPSTHEFKDTAGIRRAHERSPQGPNTKPNVEDAQHWASVAGGIALLAYGLRRRSWGRALLTLAGGSLALHGAYRALSVDRATRKGVKGIKVEKSVRINKLPEDLYRFWRNFTNLPRFMSHLEAVTILDDKRSHWVAKGPAGMRIEWDAEIIKEQENHMLAWRSTENAEVKNAGSVYFEGAPGGTGTEVKVILNYEPPGGRLGTAVAKLFGEEPSMQVEEDLHRFKRIMEMGEA